MKRVTYLNPPIGSFLRTVSPARGANASVSGDLILDTIGATGNEVEDRYDRHAPGFLAKKDWPHAEARQSAKLLSSCSQAVQARDTHAMQVAGSCAEGVAQVTPCHRAETVISSVQIATNVSLRHNAEAHADVQGNGEVGRGPPGTMWYDPNSSTNHPLGCCIRPQSSCAIVSVLGSHACNYGVIVPKRWHPQVTIQQSLVHFGDVGFIYP